MQDRQQLQEAENSLTHQQVLVFPLAYRKQLLETGVDKGCFWCDKHHCSAPAAVQKRYALQNTILTNDITH